MGLRILLLSILVTRFSLVFAEDVTVTVQGVTSIATTDDNFVCATLDWWPEGKCDYGQCPWGKAGILNLFITLCREINFYGITAFRSLRIRIGGSMQDQVIYKVGKSVKKCNNFEKSTTGLFGFKDGCLTMERWDQINSLLGQTGAVVTFGLNALFGKKKVTKDGLYRGHWNSRNAHDFIKYTNSKGYKIDSWELGNELCGSGVSARIEPDQYAKDVIVLKKLLKKLHRNSTTQPQLLAPGGFFDEKWFSTFLQKSGPNVVDGITHHIYNLGAGVDPDLIFKVQDPLFLDQVTQTYKDVQTTLNKFSPWASAWVGESGGAYNSGGKDVSHTFANSFWYLDQLGMTSTFDHKVFCRQSLIGGNYGFLNTTTFVPNPDYYGALLWHRLMGKRVLSTTHHGSPYLRAYSHCSKTKSAGITVLLINMSNSTSFDVFVESDLNLYPNQLEVEGGNQREEYHLTPKDGNIQSDVLLLNGSPLVLTKTSDIPPLNPIHVDGSSPIKVAPDSIVFATIRGFEAPACA
ncbi:Glycoside hydrolase [Macleaya cordata]|uniref:Glycoside hydrolase n=1 Tax=Macleaya cordata TaxID=56857 RepID=A0A200PRA5_MACCD|nr:Glycoside hydrolase [Macleaya cordata]